MRRPIIYTLSLLLLGNLHVGEQLNTFDLNDTGGAVGSFILTITVRQ